MTVLIIEDEQQAARRLQSLVQELLPACNIANTLDSVRDAVKWLQTNPRPDLIFMDIQLGDGLSFEIFEKVAIQSPVIFTTAYDTYAIKAFKVNGLDYILKPVDKDELAVAIDKFKRVAGNADQTQQWLQQLGNAVTQLTRKNKERFVVKIGEHLKTIAVADIQYFYSQERTTFCFTVDKRHHILDYTLEQVEEMIGQENYFRINRKYLVRAEAIQDIIQYTNSRLRLILIGSDDRECIVARERVQAFRQWLDR